MCVNQISSWTSASRSRPTVYKTDQVGPLVAILRTGASNSRLIVNLKYCIMITQNTLKQTQRDRVIRERDGIFADAVFIFCLILNYETRLVRDYRESVQREEDPGIHALPWPAPNTQGSRVKYIYTKIHLEYKNTSPYLQH